MLFVYSMGYGRYKMSYYIEIINIFLKKRVIPQYGAAYLAEDLIGKILSHLIIVVMKCVMVV